MSLFKDRKLIAETKLKEFSVIKTVNKPHDCDLPRAYDCINYDLLWYGSIIECSCGIRWALMKPFLDGPYWESLKPISAGNE